MALYVYGLVDGGRTFPAPLEGVAGAGVRAVDTAPLAALVSEMGEERELGVEDVAAHTSVLEAAFAGGPVLPFRFATVVTDEGALRTDLAPRLEGYSTHLRRLAGRVELEVRAVYDEGLVLRRVLEDDPQLRELSRAVGQGAAMEDRLELGELVASRLDERKAADAGALDERLSRVATAVSAMDPGEDAVLRAAYLVAEPRVEEFVAAGREVGETIPWMSVDIAGPVPPYSFADPPEWSVDERQIWMEEAKWTSR